MNNNDSMKNNLYSIFLLYVNVRNKIDAAVGNNEEPDITQDEIMILKRVQEIAGNDTKIANLLNLINNSVSSERKRIVDDFFKKYHSPNKMADRNNGIGSSLVNSSDAVQQDSDDLRDMFSNEYNMPHVNGTNGASIDSPKSLVIASNIRVNYDEQSNQSGFVNNIIFVLLMALVFIGLVIEIIYFI